MRIEQRASSRRGLLIRGNRGEPEVKEAYIRFARWMRREHEFPVRVPVYLSARPRVKLQNGQLATASFFAPFSRKEEPYIRVATGDYGELKVELGRNDALAAMLHSLCHELVHYQQWIRTGTITERGVVRKAGNMLQAYADYALVP